MAKKNNKANYEYNPVKETIGGQEVERVIWSTKSLNAAVQAINEGKPLKVNPFIGSNTKLLKPDLLYKRTREEIEDYIRCKQDPVYFASKCFLMTPEGLKPCVLRDYQIEYLKHLQKNRFSIFLSCRQSGKCFNVWTNVLIKFDEKSDIFLKHVRKIDYFYIGDGIYSIPAYELYNMYGKRTFLWKIKYQLYKLIDKLENNGRKKRTTS